MVSTALQKKNTVIIVVVTIMQLPAPSIHPGSCPHTHTLHCVAVVVAHRSYEQSVLEAGQGGPKQVDAVRQLYHRQLQTPQPAAQQLLQEYEDWEKQHGQVGVWVGAVGAAVGEHGGGGLQGQLAL